MDDFNQTQEAPVQSAALSDEEVTAEIAEIDNVLTALKEEQASIAAALTVRDQNDDSAITDLLTSIDEANGEAKVVEGEVIKELEDEAEKAAREALEQA